MTDITHWSRRNLLRGTVAAAGALAVPGLLTACSKTETGSGKEKGGSGNLLDKLKKQGYVKVGFADEQPYGFKDKDSGDASGESPAVIGYIFKQLGVDTLKPTVAEFNSLIPALNAGSFDVIAAGMSILPKRCKNALFSEPVYQAGTAIMVKKGNPHNITDFKSVAKAKNFKLGVMSAAVEKQFATSNGVKESSIQTVKSQQDGLDSLVAGRIDGFALTAPSLNWLAKINESKPVEVTEPFTPTMDGKPQANIGGAVFRKDSKDLVDKFNQELAKLHKNKAQFVKLIKPFGFTEKALPTADMTTKKLCAASG